MGPGERCSDAPRDGMILRVLRLALLDGGDARPTRLRLRGSPQILAHTSERRPTTTDDASRNLGPNRGSETVGKSTAWPAKGGEAVAGSKVLAVR